MSYRVPFDSIQANEANKAELIDLLESQRGRKCLYYDPNLTGYFDPPILDGSSISIVGVSNLLRDNGVVCCTELKTAPHIVNVTMDIDIDAADCIIYIVRPTVFSMKAVSKQVLLYKQRGFRGQSHVYYVSHRTVLADQILQDDGVLDLVEIHELSLGFMALESDVLSLQLPSCYKDIYVDGDASCLTEVAHGINRLQSVYGVIPNIKAIGQQSKRIIQQAMHLRKEEEQLRRHFHNDRGHHNNRQYNQDDGDNNDDGNDDIQFKEGIDTLIIMDRETDLASMFVTPLTYEGLIDEVFSIHSHNNNQIIVDSSIVDDSSSTTSTSAADGSTTTDAAAAGAKKLPKSVAITLNNTTDILYSETRNLSIEVLGSYLKNKAQQIKDSYSAFRDNKEATISDIHTFIKKMPNLTKNYKSLNQHINIAAVIKLNTDSREFRELWQVERGILEGESCYDQIEDWIYSDVDRVYFHKIIRLLCLQSVSTGGIRTNRWENIRKLIVQTYGYETIFLLLHLEKAGLIKRKDALFEGSSVWQSIVKKNMRLLVEQSQPSAPVTQQQPQSSRGTAACDGSITSSVEEEMDISYVAAGYAPLSVRVIQSLILRPTLHNTGSSGSSGMTTSSISQMMMMSGKLQFPSVSSVTTATMNMNVLPTGGMSGSSEGGAVGIPSWSVAQECLRSLVPGLSITELTQSRSGRAEEMTDAVARYQAENNVSSTSSSTASTGLHQQSLAAAAAVGSNILTSVLGSVTGGGSAAVSGKLNDNTISSSSNNIANNQQQLIQQQQQLLQLQQMTDDELNINDTSSSPPKRPVMMICLMGGISHLEIAAFRHLSSKQDSVLFPYDIVLSATCITNGTKFIESFSSSGSSSVSGNSVQQ